jgi:hypothetical protein
LIVNRRPATARNLFHAAERWRDIQANCRRFAYIYSPARIVWQFAQAQLEAELELSLAMVAKGAVEARRRYAPTAVAVFGC